MSFAPMTTLAETSAAGGVNPYVVGISIFTFLLILMAGLLFFGAGRDHS